MSDISMDTAPPDVALGQIYKGVIAIPPINFTAKIGVIMPDIHPDLVFHCKWQSRDNMSFPQVEDDVLIVWDNENEPWVITWWPAVRNPMIYTGNYADGAPADAVQDDIWIAYNVNSTCKRLAFQYDASANKWQPISLVPNPPVNGKWVFGQGGAAIWKQIDQVDLPDNLNVKNTAYATDLNNCTANGWYSFQPSTANSPGGYGYCQTMVLSGGVNYKQLAYGYNSNQRWTRRLQDNGGWGAWYAVSDVWWGPQWSWDTGRVNLNNYWYTDYTHNLGNTWGRNPDIVSGWLQDTYYGFNMQWMVTHNSINQVRVFAACIGNTNGVGAGQATVFVRFGYIP